MSLNISKKINMAATGLLLLGLLLPVKSQASDLSPLPVSSPWTILSTLPLPGGTTRFDYQSVDSRSGRLYLAHLGDSRLVVVDTKNGRVISDLPDFPHVHGVLAVPSLGRIFATVSSLSRTKPGELAVVDMRTLKTLSLIPVGIHPDGLAFEPATGRIFVSNEWGKTVSVVDSRSNRNIATIPLGGEVGNTQVDRKSHRIFSAVQTRNLLVRIDPYALHVDRKYRLPCRHPHGLALDEKRPIAYIACEGDDRLLALDLRAKKILADLPVGHTPDVLALDRTRNILFVASESGNVSVYKRVGATLSLLSTTFLGKGAHTIALDPRTHHVFLPLEDKEGQPALEILRFTEVSPRPNLPGRTP